MNHDSFVDFLVREFVENDTLEKILNMNQPENSQVEKKYKLSFWRKMNIVQTGAPP